MIGLLKVHRNPVHLPIVHIIGYTMLPHMTHNRRISPEIIQMKALSLAFGVTTFGFIEHPNLKIITCEVKTFSAAIRRNNDEAT